MIALCGIVCGIFLGFGIVCEHLRRKFGIQNNIPTKEEVNDLTNKLNRIALDRANRKDK